MGFIVCNNKQDVTITKQRIPYIDVFRGLCMLLVVLGHSIGVPENGLNRFILSFHMPIFFFISGYCFYPKTNHLPIWKTIKRKMKSLGYSYLVWSIVGVAFYWLIASKMGVDKNVSLAQSCFGIIWNDNVNGILITDGFWFVYDLLWINLIYIIVGKDIGKKSLGGGIILLLFLYLSYTDYKFHMKDTIEQICCGFLFFFLGDVFSRNIEKLIFVLKFKYISYLIVGGLILSIYIISQLNKPVLMAINQYGNPLFFLLSSFMGCVAIFCISYFIRSERFLEYVGVNSILFLFFHFIILNTSHVIFNKLIDGDFNNYEYPYFVFHFVIAVVVSCAISWVINNHFTWLIRYPKKYASSLHKEIAGH